MSNIRNVIIREMAKSNGKVRVVKVPQHMRPTPESLRRLEREIGAQIDANEAMRQRSMIYASGLVKKR